MANGHPVSCVIFLIACQKKPRYPNAKLIMCEATLSILQYVHQATLWVITYWKKPLGQPQPCSSDKSVQSANPSHLSPGNVHRPRVNL